MFEQFANIKKTAEANLSTKHGAFRIILFQSDMDHKEHIALIKGSIKNKKDVLVRVHSECITSEIFSSNQCDCSDQLHKSMQMIENEGKGVILYMRQEGRGIGLTNKIRAYHLQDNGLDTVEANHELGFDADLRDYGVCAQILHNLGLSTIRLLTNNPQKISGLEGNGLKVTKRIPIVIKPNENNRRYLETKKQKLKHLL